MAPTSMKTLKMIVIPTVRIDYKFEVRELVSLVVNSKGKIIKSNEVKMEIPSI